MEPNAQRPDHDGETFLASPIAVVGPAAARSLGGGGRRFLLEEEEEAEKNFPYGRVMLKIPVHGLHKFTFWGKGIFNQIF